MSVWLRRKTPMICPPDMGHYSIHHAIFHLLEIAPVDGYWQQFLYELLNELDFQQVAHPETIETALSRWAQLDDKINGEPTEGYCTSLPLKDEFRCLIAALVRKQRPYLESFLSNEVRTEAAKNDGVDEKAITRAVESAINKIAAKISSFIYVGLGFLAAAVYMIGHRVGAW